MSSPSVDSCKRKHQAIIPTEIYDTYNEEDYISGDDISMPYRKKRKTYHRSEMVTGIIVTHESGRMNRSKRHVVVKNSPTKFEVVGDEAEEFGGHDETLPTTSSIIASVSFVDCDDEAVPAESFVFTQEEEGQSNETGLPFTEDDDANHTRGGELEAGPSSSTTKATPPKLPPMFRFLQYRSELLQELVLLEGPVGVDSRCCRCGIEGSEAIYRCPTCNDHPTVCKKCVLATHARVPLHWVEVRISFIVEGI